MDRRATFIPDAVERHGQAAKRFQSLCAMHGIAPGEGGGLRGLVARLREDRHLAMDFWAMVGDLSERERGTLSDDEMLNVVVEGSTGHEVAALPQDDRKAAEMLQQMLAGVDVVEPGLPDAIERPEDDLLARSAAQPQAATHKPMDVTAAQRRIAEALLKLEQTSRELRAQLEELETAQKNEPQEEAAVSEETPKTPEKRATSGKSERAVFSSAMAETKRDFAPPPSLLKEETVAESIAPASGSVLGLSRSKPTFAEPEDDPAIPVPLSEYEESTRRGWGFRIAWGAVALVVAGALWFVAKQGNANAASEAVRNQMNVFWQELHAISKKGTPEGSPPASPPAAVAPPAVEEKTPPDATAAPAPAAVTPEKEVASTKPEPSTPPAEHLSGISANVVRISAGEMEARLVTSRVPAYPLAAKERGIAGTVTLEALISKSGAVQQVHAVDGDPSLRAAAEDAVRRWRYQPYLVNGQPVEAATEVKVAFRLPE